MAHIKSAGDVELSVTIRELETIRRALRLVHPFGECEDVETARALLADLEVMPS